MLLDLYQCESCKISWEFDRKTIKNKPTKKKCPSCGKLREKVISTPHIIWKGGGWDSTKREYERYRKKGMDKDTADEFLKTEIEFSKERMDRGGEVYTHFVPNIKNQEKAGRAKKVSEKKAAEKLELARKITREQKAKMGQKK